MSTSPTSTSATICPSPTTPTKANPGAEQEQPFTISIPDSALTQLRTRLASSLSTLHQATELESPDSDSDPAAYGVPLADLRRLVERWASAGPGGYDWRAHEAALNEEMPQFTRDVQVEGHGVLSVHYVHRRSSVRGRGAIPLLWVHGWPGSFLEARKIIPLLTGASSPASEKSSDPDQPSFHFVGLSLPGFGFSEAPRKAGFGLDQYAEVGHKLMLALGYDEYVTQGGDWGYVITRRIATNYGPKHAKAWHTNFPSGDLPHPLRTPLSLLRLLLRGLSPSEKAGLARTKEFFDGGSGYMAQQCTRPQTIGYALADSPVALLAWVYEKLVEWTDGYAWSDDEVLTWVSIYYFSRAGPAAASRIYYEATGGSAEAFKRVFSSKDERPMKIPLGVSHFPKEVVVLPHYWAKSMGKLVFQRVHTRGGHFAAWEQPEALVQDLRDMFRRGGPAFGVVSGRSGY